MSKKSNWSVRLRICNYIAIAFFIVVIPGYYIVDYYSYDVMAGIFLSCAIYLIFVLLQCLIFKRFGLLATFLAIFILHVISLR